jgi:hypothetical protein
MKADWLSQLAPDRAPPPVGWWPPAPGWWALALVLVAGLAGWAIWLWRRRRAPDWRRAALRELVQLEASAADDATLARGLQHLLRRYAMVRYGRDAVAGLSGDAWVAFIASHGGAELAGDAGRLLLRCAYSGAAAADRARWLGGTRGFLKARA